MTFWIQNQPNIGSGAYVRRTIAPTKLTQGSAKVRCIVPNHAGKNHLAGTKKSGAESQPEPTLYSDNYQCVTANGRREKCAYCGKELKRKSRNGRFPKFCNSLCRVRAWREKQKGVKE